MPSRCAIKERREMIKKEQFLSVLTDNGFKECRIVQGPRNTTTITGTSTKSGKLTDKNILEAIHNFPYQNISLAVDNSIVVYLKQEKKFKI